MALKLQHPPKMARKAPQVCWFPCPAQEVPFRRFRAGRLNAPSKVLIQDISESPPHPQMGVQTAHLEFQNGVLQALSDSDSSLPSPQNRGLPCSSRSQRLLTTFRLPSRTLNTSLIRHNYLLQGALFSCFVNKAKLGGQVTCPVSQTNHWVLHMQTQACLKSGPQLHQYLQAVLSMMLDCPSLSPRPIFGT